MGKGFMDFFNTAGPDILALQEVKMERGQAEIDMPGYFEYWNSAEKKGYSGTALFTKRKPLDVTCGIGIDGHDREGRVITAEYRGFYFVCCYTPNARRELLRLDYRMRWEDDFLAYLKALDAKKPVILAGDLNVAHNEIDIKNPGGNRRNAGFTDEERGKMTRLLNNGFVDTFRSLHPDTRGAYTWWSYMHNARANNAGWRIDYFIVSERLGENMAAHRIHAEVMGSDHCPIELELDMGWDAGGACN
jgi:exodeoxyribonuclease-3